MDEQGQNLTFDGSVKEGRREVGVCPPPGDALSAVEFHHLRRGLTAFVRRFGSGARPVSISNEEQVRQVGAWLEVAARLGDAVAEKMLIAVLLRGLDEGWWPAPLAVGAMPAAASRFHADVRAAMIKLLNVGDSDAREWAVRVLAAAAADHADVRTALIRCLDDSHGEVRRAACAALKTASAIHADVRAALIRCLDGGHGVVRMAACWALASAVEHAEARAALMERLSDDLFLVRMAACRALASAARIHADARTALVHCLDDADEQVRAAAVEALAPAAVEHAEARAALVERLGDVTADVRSAASKALAGAARTHADVRAVLVERLNDADERVREAACRALSDAVQVHGAALAAVALRLDDGAWGVRAAACETLAPCVTAGVGDANVREQLIRLLDDGESSVRAAACRALAAAAAQGGADAWRALVGRLGDQHPWVREVVVGALAAAVGAHPGELEPLMKGLVDTSWVVRKAAVQALAPAARTCAEVRAALIRCLNDKHPGVMTAAYGALAATGKDAVVVHELAKRFFDKDRWVRETALAVLSPALSPSTQEFLLEALLWGDWSAEVWGMVVSLLGSTVLGANPPATVLSALALAAQIPDARVSALVGEVVLGLGCCGVGAFVVRGLGAGLGAGLPARRRVLSGSPQTGH